MVPDIIFIAGYFITRAWARKADFGSSIKLPKSAYNFQFYLKNIVCACILSEGIIMQELDTTSRALGWVIKAPCNVHIAITHKATIKKAVNINRKGSCSANG